MADTGVQTSYGRTRKSLRNSFVAVGLQFVSILIGFWSRRIFLYNLGTEILGLNTTATNLLNFLNLAELGIGSAIAVTLYKPIFDDDKDKIREIVALQGWIYRFIALIVMGGSIVLMCFFPLIFAKTPLPLWYSYASFGVMLYSSLLGYFFNYKQILLDAYQMNYKIQLSIKLVNTIRLLFQAIAVYFLVNGYFWWLALEVIFSTITAIILKITVDRTFPYLREEVPNKSELRFKYPTVVTKTKQLFVHKIGTFAINQAVPLIIYGFTSLTMVAKYGNYLLFTANLSAILTACFLGLAASVGNMVAENDRQLTLKVFRELFCARFAITSVCCISLWFLIDPFLSLWIGREFILSRTTLLLIVLVFCVQNTRNVVDIYLNAYGMFQDIWAPIAEAGLCLGFALLLGHFYGLNGILTGQLISQIVIAKIWKPVFLFRSGLREPLSMYLGLYSKLIAILAATVAVIYAADSVIHIDPSASYLTFGVYALLIFVPSCIVMYLLCYWTEEGMRGFTKRMLTVLVK